MDKLEKRARRKTKIRQNVSGSALIPRVSVYKSNRYVYCQAIDDAKGRTLASASAMKSTDSRMKQSEIVGKKFALALQKKKIDKIVFDRSGFKYHGAVKKLAEVLRDNKIKF